MKIRLLIILLYIPVLITAQQNVAKTTSIYDEQGKLQMLIQYNPSCSCRTYTEYYPDGKVYAKRVFKVVPQGEFIDGEDISYYYDGTIKQYKVWKDAVPVGRAYSNYENGQLEHEEFYENKLKAGAWRYFNKKGVLSKEHIFTQSKNAWNSKKDDFIVKYYADNKVLFTEVYKSGKKISSDLKEDPKKAMAANTEEYDGKKLFSFKCSACHTFDKDGFGPSLKDVTKRRNNQWLYAMVKDGAQLVKSGDKEAITLYNQWRQTKHPSMEKLDAKQIQLIIAYLKQMNDGDEIKTDKKKVKEKNTGKKK